MRVLFLLADNAPQIVEVDAGSVALIGSILGGIYVLIQIGDRLWRNKRRANEDSAVDCRFNELRTEILSYQRQAAENIARLSAETEKLTESTEKMSENLVKHATQSEITGNAILTELRRPRR